MSNPMGISETPGRIGKAVQIDSVSDDADVGMGEPACEAVIKKAPVILAMAQEDELVIDPDHAGHSPDGEPYTTKPKPDSHGEAVLPDIHVSTVAVAHQYPACRGFLCDRLEAQRNVGVPALIDDDVERPISDEFTALLKSLQGFVAVP